MQKLELNDKYKWKTLSKFEFIFHETLLPITILTIDWWLSYYVQESEGVKNLSTGTSAYHNISLSIMSAIVWIVKLIASLRLWLKVDHL